MFDAELQIVSSQVVDVSEGTSQLSSSVAADVLAIGRSALVGELAFTVVIEAVTAAAAGANVKPVAFYLQRSNDNGSTYGDIAVITLSLAASIAKKGVWSVPLGSRDGREDVMVDADSILRVKVTYTDNTETDDFTYSAYITTKQPYPGNDLAD